MEYDPAATLAYLSGTVDKCVKQQARDTLAFNAERDPKARYARIPDGNACDFCLMLGSRGFVYHSEESAGGSAHGTKWDTYHPYCNCQIAVTFDPVFEEYYVGLTKVRRGYALDAQVTVPGRDGSDAMRQVDIDDLFAQYKAIGKDFKGSTKLHRSPNDYRVGGTALSDDEFAEAKARLSRARTPEELVEIADDIVAKWPENEYGRNPAQWRELSEHAQELDRMMKDYSHVEIDPNQLAVAALRYVNSSETLWEYAAKIVQLDDYEDVVAHCDGISFGFKNLDAGNRHEKERSVSVFELSEMLDDNPDYHGGAIRLIACSAGKYPDGAAQTLANLRGVDVLAPLQDVNVGDDGIIWVFNREYDEEGNLVKPPPYVWTEEFQRSMWKVFHPRPS